MASGAALVGGVLVALAAYTLYGAYWRLYLSPVAMFPTRKLAALTFWYEFYYDVIKGGAYVYEIEKMHKELGERHHRRPSKCFLFQLRVSKLIMWLQDPSSASTRTSSTSAIRT